MIVIRKAKLNDINNIVELWLEGYDTQVDIVKKHCPQHLNDFNFKDDCFDILKDFIKKTIFSNYSRIYLSEEDNKPFGYIKFSLVKNSPICKIEKFGRIDNIYIKKEYQGKEVSSKLKDEAFKWFKKKGANRVQLFVFKDNIHAINVYEKWGFSTRLIEMRMSV